MPERPRPPKPPRALRAGSCSEKARHLSKRIGLSIVEVENLLREGRTPKDLEALVDNETEE